VKDALNNTENNKNDSSSSSTRMNDELTGTKQKGEIEKELYTIREEEEKKRKEKKRYC